MNALARWVLTALVVVGLAIDVYTHLDLAAQYQFNRTSTVSQETLFRLEAALAAMAAIALMIRVNLVTALVAFAVAGGGLALLVTYKYVDVGSIGPIPDMYEPLWFAEKSWSAAGEAVAAVAAAAVVVAQVAKRRATGRATSSVNSADARRDN